MSAISEEKILRINCPGFGTSAVLPLGEAKPLAMYDVIVVNPTSILHLFDSKSDLIKQIEVLQSDGMTSYRSETDDLLSNLNTEFEIRAQELGQFLKKGGLLVVYLVPPFSIVGPNVTVDNYSWLGEWCPDKPSGPNMRNMSATIRGKAVEVSAESAQSVWVPYLKQSSVEWSTIIRQENLTEGYVPLATAGPNKCIAGFKSSGPKAGQVVFLPAPYAQELDGKLKECIERWYAMHTDESTATPALQNLSKGLQGLLSDDEPEPVCATPEPVAATIPEPDVVQPFTEEPAPAASDSVPEPAPVLPEKPPASSSKGKGGHKEPPQFFDTPPDAASNDNNGNPAHPDALIKKMQQELNNNNNKPNVQVPEWCSKFSFDELDGLRQQLADVNEEIRLAQIKAQDLDERITRMEDMKNALLSAQGEPLMTAVVKVFEQLGWTVKPALGSTDEVWLVEDDKTQAIVSLVYSNTQPNRSELAGLAESVITYWGAHEVEPKGILVASTWADKPPTERPDEDFAESMHDFAKRKNLALLTTSQLLSIYRDMEIIDAQPRDIRENILTTSGRVAEYAFNKKEKAVKR